MSFLFASRPPSYAEEQLTVHLASLSTLPVHPSTSSFTSGDTPLPVLRSALQSLCLPALPDRSQLIRILKSMVRTKERYGSAFVIERELDKAMEAEITVRATTIIWKEVMQVLLDAALQLEEERSWWDSCLSSRRGVGIYLVQTLPLRLYRALPPVSSFSLQNMRRSLPSRGAIFRPLQQPPTVALTSMLSPFTLTRREMLATRKALTVARDDAARKIGILASQGPRWTLDSRSEKSDSYSSSTVTDEAARLYDTLCAVLGISNPPPPAPTPSKKPRMSSFHPEPVASSTIVSPSALLAILSNHLPQSHAAMERTLVLYRRPSPITRLWFPLLFLPPVVLKLGSSLSKNEAWIKTQVGNARETVTGFVIQWVWEPLEGIGKTLRGGGEGLGVAPTTVKSDQESLERMVADLGRDYYHLSGAALDSLREKVRNGDMEEVLRVYEKELQSPLKNVLLGSLVRTLLIQVQKTKTDLSLSLLSLDHLLRSQQLTFAFVGVAPSVLILYGLGGWLRGMWRGEKRGKGRRREYFNRLRDIERLLLSAPKQEKEMSERERGLLIVGVNGMRTWAAGLGGSKRGAFLDDLRMVEDPLLSRGIKLRVVERIWRCWGVDGRESL